MGGEVDGVVAIVQGLPDAGLAVTMMGREHGRQSNVNAPPERLLQAKSLIETSAWPVAADAAAQICDDRYTSTYQLAHCNARPTSPPVNLPEFPRQRAELCRTQGNFEIGIVDNSGTRSPVKINLYQRNGFSSPDRGSLTTSQSSRGTETFVNSLRKYPTVSPDNSFSSDLVLRLISYTQAKNFSKGSYHSKSMRNLRNKRFREQTNSPELPKNKSKSVQTYTRTEKTRADEDTRKEPKASTSRYRSASPVHEQRDNRSKDRRANETYDYLRSSSPRRFNRMMNVRYLNDVTRCLRDTMRQICDDTPQVCPNFQSRYSRHRREHHTDLRAASESSHNMEPQAPVPLVSTGVPAFSTCRPTPGTYIQTCPLQPKKCCFCRKPLPCKCKRRPSAIQDEDDFFKSKLEEQVSAWLQEIPVFVNDTPHNQVIRENMVRDLIDKLKSLECDDYFEQNANNEISECVANLPMWYPGDKRDQDLFKTQIIDNLMNKIRSISSKSVNHKDEISKWIDDISFKPRDSEGNIIDKRSVKEDLVNRLNTLASNPPKDQTEKKSEIVEILNEFPIEVDGDKATYISDLAETLADKMQTLPSKGRRHSETSTDKFQTFRRDSALLTQQVLEWMDDVPELQGSKLENQKAAAELGSILKKSLNQGKDASAVRDDISTWLTNTLEHKGERLDPEHKNDLVKKLFDTVNTTPSKERRDSTILTKQVLEWMDDVPELQGSKLENQKIAAELGNILKKSLNQGKDASVIRDDISTWLTNTLERKGERLDPEHKNDLVKKLFDTVNTTPSKERRDSTILTKQVLEWMDDVPELQGSKLENQKIAAELGNTLKKSLNQGKDASAVRNDISTWLTNTLESKGKRLDSKQKNDLVKKLFNTVNATPSKERRDSILLTKQVLEWMDDVPELQGSKLENQKTAAQLGKILKESLNQGKDASAVQDDISTWLTNTLERKGKRLDSKQKNDLVKKLFDTVNTEPDKKNVETISNDIFDVLEDIPNLDMSTTESKNLVKELAKKMQELQSYNGDDSEAVKNEIVDWVNKLSENTGVNLNSKDKENLINKLMAIIPGTSNRRKRWSKQEDLVLSAINDQLSGIFEKNSVDIGEADKKKIQDKISALIYKNIDKIKTGDTKQITTDLFNILEDDAKIPAKKAKQISDEILKKVKTMKLPRRRSSELNEEVGNALGNSNVYIEKKDEVNANLSNILADQAMRGENDEQTKARLLSVLKNSNQSDEESDKSATQLKGKGKELSHRSQKSESSRSFQTLPPMRKQMFVDSAQKEILDFTKDLTNDSGVSSMKKWEAAACELAENIGDLVSDPNTSSVAKKDLIKDEIVNYLENNDIQSGSDPEVQANKLVGRLKKLVFTTSTPRNSDVDRSLYPSKSTIGYDSTSSQYQRQLIPTKEEVQYSSELVNKIDNWLKTLPIDMDSAENKDFKETMIKDLAGGMIDRQKYLQLNPNAKTSHVEELEHLKYQVFRWLNKLPDGKQLMPSLAKTHELMESIKAVPVPQLTRENTFRDSFTSQVPDLSLLEAEISKWIETVPSDQYTSTDKYRQKQMIKELAKNIQNIQKNNTLTEPVLDDIIIEWLKEMVNDSKESLLNLSESLKSILINKRIISFVQNILLKREQSLNFKEDIRSHILGWLKEKPLYQRRNSMEKQEQEQIFTQLSKALKDASVAETNNLQKDTMLLEAIKSHLQRLPKDSHLVNDNKFLQDMANDLLAHLKKSNIYKEIIAGRSHISQSTSTEPGFKKAADILFDNIENWCNNLPIPGGDTPEEREKIKTLKQNIGSKLINKIGDLNMNPEIFNDDTLYEDMLNDEIDDLLNSLPQTDELNNNKAALKDSLIEKIKEAKQKTQSELAGHAYKQQLRDAISTTLPSVQNLTIDEQVPFEILKDNLADAYINLHYSPENVELQNKLKQKIQDELNTFCNDYLKRFPASPVNAEELNKQLYTALQKVPMPKDETIKAQVEQVRIKDIIHEWLKNIPVNDDSPAQQMQKNKIVSVLGKLLHETEKEKNANPDIDVDDKMRKDITKWTNKLPLKPGAVSNIDKEVDKLIDSLKSTEDSRRFSISKLKSMADRSKTPTSQHNKRSQNSWVIPPSCLCLEDRAHLEQIRQRTQRSSQYCPEMSLSKDAYVNPIPVDEGSQTEIGSQNHRPLSPNVVVNEYEWNSTDASRIQESYNGLEANPDMLGRSYPMIPQQMPPQYLQSQQQSISWPQPNAQNSLRTSATSQNQYVSGPQTSCLMPPPCPLQSPCTMSRRLCTVSPPFSSSSVPCAPSPPPCAPPPPPYAPPQPPCAPLSPPCAPLSPPCAPLSPPCAPSPPSARPTPSYAPSQLPFADSEQPCDHPTPSYAPHQSPCARQNVPFASPQAPCHPPQSPCTRPPPPCTRPPPPCSRPTLPCPTPQPSCYSPPQPCTPSPCMFQPPCMAPTPSKHRMRSYPSRLPNSPSPEVSSGPSKRWVPRRLHSENSRDFSSTSSPFDDYPDGVMSRSLRQPPRVTRLGSFDEVPFTMDCGSQSPRAKPSRGSPCEESQWSIRPPDDYLGTSCTRRRPCRIPRNANGPLIKERKEETVRCYCGRKPRPNHPPCRRTDSMQRCSKCCGEYCPHPSYMYFR